MLLGKQVRRAAQGARVRRLECRQPDDGAAGLGDHPFVPLEDTFEAELHEMSIGEAVGF